jgi:hypothetical protein
MSRPRGWVLRSGVSLCLLALPGSGCSLLLVKGPPAEAQQLSNFDCTTGAEAPAIDTLLAVVGGFSTLFLLALSGLSDTGDPRGKVALFALPAFVLPAGSAAYGFATISRCRRARADLAVRSSLAPPPMAAVAGPASAVSAAPAPAPGRVWQPALLRSAAEVRSAPFQVAPVVQRFAAGDRITVSIEVRDGWRRVALAGGFGYVPDAAVTIDDGPTR